MRLGVARRDWLQQLRLMCSIMLMRLQELCKTCASLVEDLCTSCRAPVIISYFVLRKVSNILAQFLCKSCRAPVILFYFIAYGRTALRNALQVLYTVFQKMSPFTFAKLG